ncbi:MAG: AI-2E family transporter, partial [Chloroflexota bacterium]
MGQNGWVQPIRYLIVGLVFLAIVWFISVASALINSLIVAALFAYVLSPLVNLLIRYTRLSHNAAVNITHLLFLSILIAVPAILTPFALRQIGNITPDIDAIIDQAREIIEEPIQVGELSFSLENSVSNFEQLLVDTTTFIAGNTVSTISVISTNFVWILVVLVSIYYLLKDSHLMVNSFIRLISPEYQFHARKLIQEIDMIWGRFLRGQLLLMLIVGVMSWLGVLAVGLPGAFVIGLTAGILDIIPSLGPTLAAVIAVAVAFTQGSTYLPISNVVFGLVVLLIFAFVQQIENIWIR